MSYLVMARKWRPKNFEEMVGQEHIAQTLRNAIASGRVSHAYLFTGTRGVGKTTSARILAKALNCLNGPTATPCETCDNCLAVNRGSSMDVLEIDGASNNSVDNIRELREQVAYAPMQGGSKIYIIDEVHMLSKAAFNALLKTLEEPPPHVVFIFATTEVGKVPHTILSRVQRFDFKRISESAIADRLAYICEQEGITPERAALEALARKADGSMRDALSLFDRVYAFAGDSLTLEAARKALGIPAESLFDDLLKHLSAHDAGGCLAVLNSVYEDGLEVSEFLTGFGEYLRDLLFGRQPGVTPALLGLSPSRFAELRNLAGDLQDGDILRYAKIISDLIAGLKTSPHPRLWVELGLARMAALDRVVTLSQLMGQDVPAAPPLSSAPPSASDADPKKKSPELTGAAASATGTANPHLADTTPEAFTTPENTPAAPFHSDLGSDVGSNAGFNVQAASPTDFRADIQGDEVPPGLGGMDAGSAHAAGLNETSGPLEAIETVETVGVLDQDDEADIFSVTTPFDPEEGGDRPAPVIIAPLEAPARWADLVEDYALDRPFTSSPLRHSTLNLKTRGDAGNGGTTGLEVEFAGEHYHDLFLADADNRKSLRAFLAARFPEGASFALTFATLGGVSGEDAADTAGGAAKPIHPAASTEAVIQNDPVIQSVITLFEGRVLN